ncbi:hypothetical protein FGO68_gene1331 [Halteria grandinella]|uniref:histidine kinase n=1 Tax=Halteria grandinella TaxID=5974 RepID=A0A8J8P0I2_HALGN|nr:hypothetical protein FGO68_gene1331 [Halteria grandinella]
MKQTPIKKVTIHQPEPEPQLPQDVDNADAKDDETMLDSIMELVNKTRVKRGKRKGETSSRYEQSIISLKYLDQSLEQEYQIYLQECIMNMAFSMLLQSYFLISVTTVNQILLFFGDDKFSLRRLLGDIAMLAITAFFVQLSYFLIKKFPRLRLYYVFLLSFSNGFLITEIQILSFNRINLIEGFSAYCVGVSAYMLASYDQFLVTGAFFGGSIYMIGRMALAYGFSHELLRFSIFHLAAIILLCVSSRAQDQSKRQQFMAFHQQKQLVQLFRTVVRANHDGIIITSKDQVLYNNSKVLKIMKIGENQQIFPPNIELDNTQNAENSSRELRQQQHQLTRKSNSNELMDNLVKEQIIRTLKSAIVNSSEENVLPIKKNTNIQGEQINLEDIELQGGQLHNSTICQSNMWDYIQMKEKLCNNGKESHINLVDCSKLDGLFFDLNQNGEYDPNALQAKLQLFSQVVEIVPGSRLVVSTIRDMSTWLELEKQRHLTQFKTVAFAQAAHEFKNPLNAIMTSLDLIQDSIINPRDKMYYQTAKNCSELMLYLIKDILDLSQIEARSFILNQNNVKIQALLEECTSIFSFIAKQKGISLIIDQSVQDDLPHEVYMDGNRLKQIIINLVSNAIKYTEKGFVKIIGQKDPITQTFTIIVQDTGVGMTSEQIGMLFTAFTKIMTNRHLNKEGVGLGLSISSNLAKALGGEIKVQSQLQLGSAFQLKLPWNQPVLSRISSRRLNNFSRRSESSDHLFITEDNQTPFSDQIKSMIFQNQGQQPKLTPQMIYSTQLPKNNRRANSSSKIGKRNSQLFAVLEERYDDEEQ